jgi:hypothetical protein
MLIALTVFFAFHAALLEPLGSGSMQVIHPIPPCVKEHHMGALVQPLALTGELSLAVGRKNSSWVDEQPAFQTT